MPPTINKFFLTPGNHDWDVGDVSDATLSGVNRLIPYADYFNLPGRGVNVPFLNSNERYYTFTQGTVTDVLGSRPLVQVFVTDSDPQPQRRRDRRHGRLLVRRGELVEASAEGQWLKRAINASNAVYRS